jgi:hypothetical protein
MIVSRASGYCPFTSFFAHRVDDKSRHLSCDSCVRLIMGYAAQTQSGMMRGLYTRTLHTAPCSVFWWCNRYQTLYFFVRHARKITRTFPDAEFSETIDRSLRKSGGFLTLCTGSERIWHLRCSLLGLVQHQFFSNCMQFLRFWGRDAIIIGLMHHQRVPFFYIKRRHLVSKSPRATDATTLSVFRDKDITRAICSAVLFCLSHNKAFWQVPIESLVCAAVSVTRRPSAEIFGR